MNQTKNPKVQNFLNDLEDFNNPQYLIIQELRKIVFEVCPQVEEKMMYGGIMFFIPEDFGGVFVRKQHISFEFTEGYLMNDPDKKLEGTGKFRRHLKIRSLDEVKEKNVMFFVKQIANGLQK